MDRIIGEFDQGIPGPLIILVGSIHGNETEGVNVFSELGRKRYPIRSKIAGLRGNLSALAAKRRYIEYDLNHCWREDHLQYLLSNKAKLHIVEDQEALAVLDILEHYLQTTYEGDQFSMKPGYENFTPVQKDEILAYDKYGPVKAPRSGMIFMPLYQNQGNDGFFIVEKVKNRKYA